MKRVLCIALTVHIMMLAFTTLASAALTVDATFSDPNLQSALGGPNGVVANNVRSQIEKYSNMPKLARGFGNAATYASHASTLRGYQGYDLFAISVGAMVSVQASNSDPAFYKNIQDEIDSGDVYAGAGVNPLVFQAGMNLGFILNGLYASFIFGKLKTDLDQGDFKIEHNANQIGGYINYAVFSEKAILSRALLWRGLTLQAGFIYLDNDLSYYNKLDKQTYTQSITGPPAATVTYTVDPSVNFELATKASVIPVEMYTSLRFLYFLNIGVGGGFDYVFSSSTDLRLSSAGDAVITDDGASNASGYVGETGKLTVDAETAGIESDKYRPKMIANVGISMGPVFIDLPVSYYLDNGYAVGVTAGFAW